ncbi:MAG: hypothetical protein M0T84_07150 [Betaproteobacteria bacterium]|nr:hypothetical protein [Betaproteobacteria bacterium]
MITDPMTTLPSMIRARRQALVAAKIRAADFRARLPELPQSMVERRERLALSTIAIAQARLRAIAPYLFQWEQG